MKIMNMLFTINWQCIIPMFLWLLGALILGWLLRHLLGNLKTSLNQETDHNQKELLQYKTSIKNIENQNASLELKNIELEAKHEATKLKLAEYKIALNTIETLKKELEIANNKPAVTIEKIVEVPTEKIVEIEVEKIVEKIVEIPMSTNIKPLTNYKALSDFFGKKITTNDLKLVEGIGPKIEELFINAGLKTWQSIATSEVSLLKEILIAAGERFKMHDPTTWPKQCQLMVDDKWAELKAYQDKLDGGKEPE